MTNKTEAVVDMVLNVQTTEVLLERIAQLQDENERQRCSIEALAARRNTMSDRIVQLEAERDYARAQLAQRQVPADGWVMVRQLPTQEMCEAAKYGVDASLSVFKWADGYKSMLAASPTPPQPLKPLTEEGVYTITVERGTSTAQVWVTEEQIKSAVSEVHCIGHMTASALETVDRLNGAHGIKGADDGNEQW